MKIVVSKDIVKIENNHSENHYGEYNVNECTFQFDDYFNNVSVKRAIFTSRIDNKSIEVDVINNKCMVPSEILKNVYDEVTLGVYGYEVSGEELLVRYSPTPDKFVVHDGSYKENAEHPEIITPSQYDIYSQALQEGLSKVDDKLVDVEKQGEYANTQGDYAKDQGDYAKEQGTNAKNVADDTQKKAEEGKFNGKSLEFIWQGTKLGVRLEGQEEYQFVDLQGVQGEIGATGEPFKIKKTYASVSEMNADFRNMAFGDYVMIASSVNEEDNAKLYTRGESAWIFISDFSGAMGIRGETGLTPNIKIGEVKTLEAGSQAKVTRSGSNEEPVFNFELPKGDKGDDYVLTEEDKVEIGEKVNTEYEKRIAENEKDIIDIESYLDSLTPKSTAKGELVHITDALVLPVFETKASGNVKQETTKGQQLYDYKNISTIADGVTNGASADENGWITMSYDNTNGTTTKYSNYWTKNLNLKENTKYNVVCEVKNVSGTGSLFLFSVSNTQGQFTESQRIYLKDLTNNSIVNLIGTTKENLENAVNGLRTYGQFNAGQNGSITFRLSVIEDTTVTPETFVYEPYTNGASPNPDYPQEIEVLEGYNLFNSFIATKYQYQTTGEMQIEKDGSFILSGNTGSNNYFGLNETLGELCPSLKVGDNVYLHLETTSAVKNIYIGENWANGYSKTITQAMLDRTVVIYGGYNQTDKIKIQVLKEPNKPYLPYGCVGYKVNGKNLFNVLGKIVNSRNINNMVFSNGGIKATLVDSYGGSYIKYGEVYKPGKYTFTTNLTHNNNNISDSVRLGFDKPVKVQSSTLTYNSYYDCYFMDVPSTKAEITATEPFSITMAINAWSGAQKDDIVEFTEIMLSKEGGEYEPYKEQIVPLDLKGNWVGKISDTIKDYLVTDKKKYWLVKNVGKYAFDGSEYITLGTTKEKTQVFQFGFIRDGKGSIFTSNMFLNSLDGDVEKVVMNYDANNGILLYIAINKDKASTVDEMKQWLSENKPEFYYPLAEPQIIELGELPEPIKTFEGINNIQVLANVDTEIEVKYALDLKKYYDNKLAEISAQII